LLRLGISKPNRFGIDYFRFYVRKDAVQLPDYNATESKDSKCLYGDTNKNNGILCTGWVIKHGNMDYLRRDISND